MTDMLGRVIFGILPNFGIPIIGDSSRGNNQASNLALLTYDYLFLAIHYSTSNILRATTVL